MLTRREMNVDEEHPTCKSPKMTYVVSPDKTLVPKLPADNDTHDKMLLLFVLPCNPHNPWMPTCVRTVRRTHDRCLPVKQVVAYGTRTAVGWRIFL